MEPVANAHWLEVIVTSISALNVLLIGYLIKKSSDVEKGIPNMLDDAIAKFDVLCKERQASCSEIQGVKANHMCKKLEQYATNNDKLWEKLTIRREQVWKKHEEQMDQIWQAIRGHSHGVNGIVKIE